MSAAAVVCPHCGARQPNRDWSSDADAAPATSSREPLRVSAGEANAILTIHDATSMDASPRGPMSLVLPRGDLSGWRLGIDWALTALAAPILVVGFVLVVARWRLWRHVVQDGHEVGLTFLFGTFGAAGVASATMFADWSLGASAGLAGVSLGALLLRLWLRRIA